MKFNYLLLLMFVLTLTSVSAWPYQLYENGTFTDLNTTNSTNYTIVTTQLVTEIITNITNNITNNNNITHNYTDEFEDYYNKNETEARYLRNGEQYGNAEVFNRAELNIKLTNLTNTDANITAQLDDIKQAPLGWLWTVIFIVGIMAAIALLLWGKENGGYQ